MSTILRSPFVWGRRVAAGVAMSAALGAAAAPESADGVRPSTPAQTYQRERTRCLAGDSAQDRATCLREAAAALAAARRGQLVNAGDLEANAVARCRVHDDADDRLACERMALGEGRVEGSVGEGAVVKEMTTRSVRP